MFLFYLQLTFLTFHGLRIQRKLKRAGQGRGFQVRLFFIDGALFIVISSEKLLKIPCFDFIWNDEQGTEHGATSNLDIASNQLCDLV